MHKPKSLEKIEERLAAMDQSSLRAFVLECAKEFKTSWIELGRALVAVRKDRLFRDWGYSTFEVYAAKEIGIRQQTAYKLIRSYLFLEREEPLYVAEETIAEREPRRIPDYEAVNVLRGAKEGKKVDDTDYAQLRRMVFDDGKDYMTVKKDLTAMIKEREEDEPAEARAKKRRAIIKRFVANVKAATSEMKAMKLVPAALLDEAHDLIDKIEACLGAE